MVLPSKCLTSENGLRVKTQRVKTSENFSEESNLPRRCRRYAEILYNPVKVISSIFWEIFWNIFCEHFFLPRSLTFFHADFGKEFPSRTLWRGPSWNCPSPSSVLCPLLYRTEHFSRWRKGQKGAEKRGGRGVASKGDKKGKRTRENRSEVFRSFYPLRFYKLWLFPRIFHHHAFEEQNPFPKKPLTCVSKQVPGARGKTGLEGGCQKRLAKGWRRVGKRLAKGWQRVGEGLAKG